MVGALGTQYAPTGAAGLTASTPSAKLRKIRHVFVIMLENEDYSATFGSPTNDPYLATTLPSEGALLKNYYGTGHFSNDNYVSFVSGQPAEHVQPGRLHAPLHRLPERRRRSSGIQQGAGCVYPQAVKTHRQPADRQEVHVEGLHGGHGQRPDT